MHTRAAWMCTRLFDGEMNRAEVEYLINEWVIGRNGEHDRAILRRKLIDGVSFETIAEEFNLSVRQTKNIVYKRQTAIFLNKK